MGISERSQREQRLTDQGEVYTRWPERRARYRHIFAPSNTVRADDTFDQLLREAVSGKQVLEIGCGTGWRRESLSLGQRLYGAWIFLTSASLRPGSTRCKVQVADLAQPVLRCCLSMMSRCLPGRSRLCS